MNNSEQDNPNFEEEWRRAFEEPELNPSDRVWAGLSHHLEGKVRQRRKRRFAYIGLAASCLLCLTWGIATWNNNIIGGDSTTILSQSGKNQPEKSIDKTYTHTNEKGLTSLQPNHDSTALSGKSIHQNQQAETFVSSEPLSTVANLPQEKSNQTKASRTPEATEKIKVELTEPKNKPVLALALPQYTVDGNKAMSDSMFTKANLQARNNDQSQALKLKHTYRKSTSKRELNNQNHEMALLKDGKIAKQAEKLPEAVGEEEKRQALVVKGKPESNKVLNTGNLWAFLPTRTTGYLSAPATIADDRLSQQLPIPVLFPQLTEEELAAQKQKEVPRPSRWISSTFTPNFFDSNVQAAYQPSSSVNTANSSFLGSYSKSAQNINKVQQDEDISRPVFSYTTGVSAGTNLAKRWTVEAGVQYINNSTDLQTHAYLQNTATSKKYPIIADLLGADTDITISDNSSTAFDGDNKIQNRTFNTELNPSSTPITLRNQYQSIGIPIKFGYQLYQQKKLRLVVSAGVSTDFFLRNTITSSEADVPAIVINSGENSAYKAVNFSGLLSFGVHYLYASRFSITVEPNYRAAMFSTTKIASNVQTLPRNIGLGVGMKYHF